MRNTLNAQLLIFVAIVSRSENVTAISSLENDYTRAIMDGIYDSLNDQGQTAQLRGIGYSDLIRADGCLSVVNDLQKYLINNTKSKISAIFHGKTIAGFATKCVTMYPQQLGVACTWNPELATLKTQQTAEVMRKIGRTFALSFRLMLFVHTFLIELNTVEGI